MERKMNKREKILSLLDRDYIPDYNPAAFFLHFDPIYHKGQAAVDKHLEYFHYTGMDFVKIQYERVFPRLPEIQRPGDWGKMPLYKKDFYEEPLKVVEGLVKAVKHEALVVMTLYSPFMCAGHTAGSERVVEHIKEDPQKVKAGMEIITESLMIFVRGCIERGIDGFYHSTQGGESGRFQDKRLFNECVRPYDLALMEEINRACIFNILHVCDYVDGYDDLRPFVDYPGHIVNCPLRAGKPISARQASNLFGDLIWAKERKGIIVAVARSKSGRPPWKC
jgi:uroporphyrinogen decarboxylase